MLPSLCISTSLTHCDPGAEERLTSDQSRLKLWLITDNVYVWPGLEDERVLVRKGVYP